MLNLFSGIYDMTRPDQSGQSLDAPESISDIVHRTNTAGDSSDNHQTPTIDTTLSPELKQALACGGNTTLNADSGLYTDIANELQNGYSNGSSTSLIQTISGTIAGMDNLTNGAFGSTNGNQAKSRNNRLTDSFPCNTFFCIRVNFVTYQQKLLGGSQRFSIESILDKNLKIADTVSGNSLTKSKMTKNFYELSLKNLSLPDRLHLSVVTGTLPAPLLNVAPSKATNTGTKDGTDTINSTNDLKPETILKNTFAAHGLDYIRKNDLSKLSGEEAYQIANMAGTDTQKPITIGQIEDSNNYTTIMSSKIKDDYYGSLTSDILSLNSFTNTLSDSINNIELIIMALNNKPY